MFKQAFDFNSIQFKKNI